MTRSSFRRARRATAMLLSVVLASAVAVLATATPAAAADSQRIEGRVTGELSPGSYHGIAVQVTLYRLFGDGGIAYSVPSTDTGEFSLSGAPGRYRIFAEPILAQHHDLVPGWYGDTPHEAQGAVIEVADRRITGLEMRLDRGVSLSGVISYDVGTDRVGAAAAFLFDDVTQEWERFSYFAVADSSGAYTITGLPPGRYALRFGDRGDRALTSTVYWEDADYLLAGSAIEIGEQDLTGYDATVGPGGVYVGRAAGVDRFETAVEISRSWIFEDTSAVFIANGLNFPDALSAGPAAARTNAPILLVAPDFVPDPVATRLAELDATGEGRSPLEVIYIVGGEPSVSPAVEAQLAEIAPVVRFAGVDRFETSRQVAEYFWEGTDVRTAYIATGADFPDALAAAPAAANESAPVILVNGAVPDLDAPTTALLDALAVTKTVIAGGPPSVPVGIADDLRDLPAMQESYRRNGVDRFQTGILTNRSSFPLADTAFLATGYGFPDALAGAALAGSVYSPVYLVMPDCVPSGVIEEILRLKVRDIILLGGEPTLSRNVMDLTVC